MLFGPDEPYEVTADGLEEHLRGFEPGLSDQSTLFVVVQPAADPNIFVQAASSEEGLIRVEAMVPQGVSLPIWPAGLHLQRDASSQHEAGDLYVADVPAVGAARAIVEILRSFRQAGGDVLVFFELF